MKIKHTVKSAYEGLKTNKSRSALTILGIVIGIASIMLVMSIGQGAQKLILDQISGLGANTIVVRPGREPSGPSDYATTLFNNSLKDRDIKALETKSNAPHITSVMPTFIVPGGATYESETYNKATVLGGDANFFANSFNVYPEEGTVFTKDDVDSKASVAIIGQSVKNDLFGGSNPIGKYVKVKDKKFRVVGVFPKKGQLVFFNVDNLVLVPWSTAQTYLLGIDYYQEFIVTADTAENVDRTVYDIKATLRGTHDITDPDKDDFFVETQQALADQISVIVSALTAMLSAIVSIALVVAGVGLMNIVLVSVTERTREIGLRKALGATEKDILLQFLLEAVMLTFFGGVVGVIMGAGLSLLAAFVLTNLVHLSWSFVFPISAAVMGILVSVLVGLVFGVYPARIASKKSPIEALQYE